MDAAWQAAGGAGAGVQRERLDDIRESPAVDMVEMLLGEGCVVVAYDPAAMKRAQENLRRQRTRR